MPFSDLGETIKDIEFEHGFYKGLLLSEQQREFLALPVEKMKYRKYQKLYDILFNAPQKRER